MGDGDVSDGPAKYRPATVRLDEYDPDWPQLYADEARSLADTLGAALVAIEHVGSTAIPRMTAKPIIDILAAVESYDGFSTVVRHLEELGYLYTPDAEADDPGRRIFRKGPQDMSQLRTHHLHVTEADSHYWQRIIAFRDHLRRHDDDAAAYVKLKQQLAARHRDEPRSYTRGKHQFVTAIERKAEISRRQ